jgi:hypothetical protein
VTTREKAHKLLDELPESEIEPVAEFIASRGENSTDDDSEPISAKRQAGLDRFAGYFEYPETAPWDWDVLRNIKHDAWRA